LDGLQADHSTLAILAFIQSCLSVGCCDALNALGQCPAQEVLQGRRRLLLLLLLLLLVSG
jgi:hypothetical protein